jgi:hypothetical protein
MYGILADHGVPHMFLCGIQYEKYLEELGSDYTGYASLS